MPYALYRLPYGDTYTRITQYGGEAEVLPDLRSLDTADGFVAAPFEATTDCPIVAVRPDCVETLALEGHMGAWALAREQAHAPKSGDTPAPEYAAAFAAFHKALREGRFEKIVLARCKDVVCTGASRRAEDLFKEACRRYPRMMIALVSTVQTGTWLAATPEILLEGEPDGRYRTIALAGTRPAGSAEPWSAKNIREQALVARYIRATLEPLAEDMTAVGPRTVRAGALEHLRTDFTFRLNGEGQTGRLTAALHPTPAVCGLPKAGAKAFITNHEAAPRTYYSGFMGPVGRTLGTHLFVTLRCMRILPDSCRLWAGGGLLDESTLEAEWHETEAKMRTMGDFIN